MKWVTGYWSLVSGLSDVEVHDNKDAAARHFKRHYMDYFDFRVPFKCKPPCTYGFFHRKYFCISMTSFNKNFGKVSAK